MGQIIIEVFAEVHLKEFLSLSKTEYGLSASTNAEHIRWKHMDSPFGSSFCVNLYDNGKVVGRALAQPRPLRTSTKVVNVAYVMDMLIDRKHRTTPSNFIQIAKETGNLKSVDLVFHTSNDRTYPLYKKLLRFPNPFALKAYGLPVRFAGVFSSIFNLKINAIDRLIEPFHWLFGRITDASIAMARLDISDRIMKDEEIEAVCKKCLQQSGAHLERTNAFLKWRFIDTPLWSASIYRIDRKGEFIGYIVIRQMELNGLNHLVLMDFILDPESPLFARIALRLWLIRQAIISHADTIFTMVNPFSAIAIKCVGFPFVTIPDNLLPHATPIFMRARIDETKELEADQSIHITLADLDYF